MDGSNVRVISWTSKNGYSLYDGSVVFHFTFDKIIAGIYFESINDAAGYNFIHLCNHWHSGFLWFFLTVYSWRSMNIQSFIKLCPFVPKILSRNQSRVIILLQICKTWCIPIPTSILSTSLHTKHWVEIRPVFIKIVRRTEILTPFKGHNSLANLKKKKMTDSNLNLGLVNINAFTNFGQILSIYYTNIERKRNSVINEGL